MEKILGNIAKPDPAPENPMHFVEAIMQFVRVRVTSESRKFRILMLHAQSLASSEKPLVLLVDDMQWADQSSIRLLQAIMVRGDR